MKKKNLAFGDAEIEKWKLHYFNIWIPNRSKQFRYWMNNIMNDWQYNESTSNEKYLNKK